VLQLQECIVKTLPTLRQQVIDAKQDCESELRQLGEPLKETDMKRHCLDQIGKFCRRFCDSLEGTVDPLTSLDDTPTAVSHRSSHRSSTHSDI
jgi:hypothetical protein